MGSIILEPAAKNTAPAIALAALLEDASDSLMLVLSADHTINDIQAFGEAIERAMTIASEGRIVTFGVAPTSYWLWLYKSRRCFWKGLDEFKEKPDKETAESRSLKSGDYYWNSGMFVTQVGTYLSELGKSSQRYFGHAKHPWPLWSRMPFIRPDASQFDRCPADSIDYAVMEKTGASIFIAMECDWNDIGSWSSLWEVSPKNKDGNVCVGDVIINESTDTFVRAEDKLVAVRRGELGNCGD